jgi:hypothetical protein
MCREKIAAGNEPIMAVPKAKREPDVGMRVRLVEATRDLDGAPLSRCVRWTEVRVPLGSANNHSSAPLALVESPSIAI